MEGCLAVIRKVKVSLKKDKQIEQDQMVVVQYRYIKELAIMKYETEERREQNLVQQSSQMQTAFSFMTAAIFMALPICVEYRGVLSLKFFFVSTSFVSAFLIASLITASLAQWRWKTESLPDVNVIKDSIVNSTEWESLCAEHIQLAQYVELIGKVQHIKAKINDRRVVLIMMSMICFYLSIVSIVISFVVAIITML
jgi:hypothetical protein